MLLAVGDEFGCNSRFIFNCTGAWRGEVVKTDLVFEGLGLLGDVFVGPTRPFKAATKGPLMALRLKSLDLSWKSRLWARWWVWHPNCSLVVRTASGSFEVSRIEAQTRLISGRTTVVIMRSRSLGSGDSSRRASMSRCQARESAFVFPVSRSVRDCGGFRPRFGGSGEDGCNNGSEGIGLALEGGVLGCCMGVSLGCWGRVARGEGWG
jgi:hypothetical protein